jgi:lambda family phage tail tape measure protein
MADLASLRIDIEGEPAVIQANRVTAAVQQMGLAGEESAKRAGVNINMLGQTVEQSTGRATRGTLLLTRGLDDLGMGLGFGRFGGAGYLLRGFEDINVALGRMGTTALASFAALGVGVAAVGAFGAAIAELVKKGVDLDEQLRKVRESTQATLSTLSPGQFGGTKASTAADQTVELLKSQAKEAQIPISDLTKSFDEINPSATRAAATLRQQVEIISQLQSHTAAFNLDQHRMVTDLEQLFEGNVRYTNQLALRLGLDRQQIQTARENGTITDLLISKIRTYTQAHQAAGDTVERANQRMQASFEQVAEAMGEGVTGQLIAGLNQMAEAMGATGAEGAARLLGNTIGVVLAGALERAANFVQNMTQYTYDLSNAFKVAQASAQAFANSLPGIAGQVGAISTLMAKGPLDVLTMNPQKLREDIAAGVKQYSDAAKQINQAVSDSFQREFQSTTPLRPTPQSDLTGVHPALLPSLGRGGGGGGGGGEQFDQLTALIKRITDAERDYQNAIKVTEALEKAGFTTAQNLDNQKLAGLTKERDTIQSLIPQLQQQYDAEKNAMNATQTEKWAQALEDAKQKVALLNVEIRQLGQSPLQAFESGIVQAVNSWGSLNTIVADTGRNITDSLASGLTSGITEMISGTEKASQAFKKMALSIIQSIEQIIIKMLVELAIQKLLGSFGGGSFTTAGNASAIQYASLANEGYASGGPVGTDTIPAWLSPGEYVLQSSAVQRIGLGNLDRLNRYAEGGSVLPIGNSPALGAGLHVTISPNVNLSTSGGASGTSQEDKEQARALVATINHVVNESLQRESRPGGKIWHTVKKG